MGIIFGTLLIVLAIFLILLVLVQRGRGGGLTGALGGMGGSSAFGAKAGDIFTRITIVTAAIWICVCAGAFYWANHQSDRLGATAIPSTTSTQTAPAGRVLGGPATNDEKSSTTAETTDAAESTEAAPPVGAPAETSESPAPATPAKTE